MSSASQFTVLFVCTGNVCRSPLAELLLRQSINTPSITTLSAGTQAMVGHQMPEIQRDIAAQLGLETSEQHRAQQLTLQHIESADLILGMERQHRSEAVKLSPRALRRTFTLREFARITEVVPDEDISFSERSNLVENMKAVVEAAAVNRGLVATLEDPEDDNVVDPYRRSQQTYMESRDQVMTALGAVVNYLNRAAT